VSTLAPVPGVTATELSATGQMPVASRTMAPIATEI
jgi:hypothetical protein